MTENPKFPKPKSCGFRALSEVRLVPKLVPNVPQRLPQPNANAASEALKFLSVARIAERWGLSEDKIARVLEKYRGQEGFMDLGSPENVRTHKRRYSIIRIHPELLVRIEADQRKG